MKEISTNSEEVIIRKVNKADAKALIHYVNTTGGESDFLTFGKDEFNLTIEQEEGFIEEVLKRNNALFLIAEMDEKIVGTLTFSGEARQRIAHTGEFGISVLKAYWGKGIGEQLIKALIDWSKESAIIRKINLRVRTDNTRAISLYKKMGFIEEGLIRRESVVNGQFYDNLWMGRCID